MGPDQIGRRIKLRQLEVLKAVVECGTMGKAADRLAVSQPVVSKAIADLERTLGVRLLDRGPLGAEPTLYGRALLKRSAVIFDELRQSVGEIEFMADPTVGELRIGCTDPMLSGLLPGIIGRLSDRHPRLTFRVSQAPSGAALYREMRERNVDLVLGIAAVSHMESDLNHEILFHERPFVVAGAQSPWARRRSIELADLIDERWALSSPESISGSHFADVFRTCGLQMPPATVFSTSVQFYSALAATGKFVTFLPKSVLWLGPKRPSIKVLPVGLPAIPWPVEIATLKDRTISPVAQIFIECAREIARPLAKG